MADQGCHNHTPESLKARFAARFLLLLCVVWVFACSSVRAEDFVPFVIPAKPNLKSSIAVTSFEPIETNDDRLFARDGHFFRGGKRVRIWGVNLSFGANMPKHEDAPHIAARLAAAGVNSVRCHHMDTSRWPARAVEFQRRQDHRAGSTRQAGFLYRSTGPARNLCQH